MAVRVLEETGLLPHLNPGVMSWEELNRLKPVSPSMGMMLETTSTRLFTEKGEAHYGSPDKDPAVRLRVLEDAGRLSIPFTTGLLVGIGENLTERAETIFAIRAGRPAVRRHPGGDRPELPGQARHRDAARRRPRPGRVPRHDRGHPAAARPEAAGAGAARTWSTCAECRALLEAGVDDWGGVSPLTPDHVNPERPWPSLERLRVDHRRVRLRAGARLTVHPEYVTHGEPWLDPRVVRPRRRARPGRGPGRPRAPRRTTGRACRGRSPTAASPVVGIGRTDLHAAIDTDGRTEDRRSDFDEVYGDWDAAARSRWSATTSSPRPARKSDAADCPPCAQAESDPAGLTDEQALALMTAEGELLEQVCRLADDLRRETVGDDVTYVVNRNINFTNVCYVGCRFCAFAQRRTDADAYSLSLDQVADRAQEAWELGATEVCMQGGIDPELPGTAYFDLAAAVKRRVPGMHVHAFSPMEIVNGASRTGLSIEDFLIKARESGLGHHPRHRRRDPRRRGPLGADQGQAADADLDRRRHHRAPAWGCGRARR